MKLFRRSSAALLAIVTVCAAQDTNDVKVSYGEVIDTRASEQRSTRLQINLKLIGNSIDGAQQVRAEVRHAVDDTGRDLIDSQPPLRVTRLYDPPAGQAECMLHLRNPARHATTVKELEGEVVAFVGKNDPAATVEFDHLISRAGGALTNAALRSAEVEIEMLTREQFDAIKNKEEADAREAAATRRMDAWMGRPLPIHSRYTQVDENSVVLKVSDPKSKVVAIEFVDNTGKTVRPRMTTGTDELRIYSFSQRPSTEMGVRILLSTPKSVIRVPFKLVDIPLP